MLPANLYKKGLLFAVVFLFLNVEIKAQQQQQQIPIKQLIVQIEQRFDIRFSYLDDDLATVFIDSKLLENDSLKDIIRMIESETQLEISRLSDRIYAIRKDSKVTICATILDRDNREPVIGATVEIIGKSRGVLTDFDGFFQLETVSRRDSVRIRYLGYEPLKFKVEKLIKIGPCEILDMEHRAEVLNEVILYEYLTKGISRQKDGTVLMDTQEFGILPGLTEADVLLTIQALPGIESIDESVSNVNVRGGSNDQNLFLWNGIRMYQSGHFFGLLSAFNPFLTKKVSISKNGTSVKYGDAVSGTIDMGSEDNIKDKFFGGAGVNFVNADLYGQIPLSKKWGFQFSARRSFTDFFISSTFESYYERSFQNTRITDLQDNPIDQPIAREDSFFYYDFSSKILYDIDDRHKLRLSFIFIDNKLTYRETLLNVVIDDDRKSRLSQNSLGFGGVLGSRWSDKFRTELSAYHSIYDLESVNQEIFLDQVVLQQNKVEESSIRGETNYNINSNFNLLSGYQFQEIGVLNADNVNNPLFARDIKEVMRLHSLYSEVTYESKNKNTFVRAGGRLNYAEKLKRFVIEPRLSLNHRFAENYYLDVKGEIKSQSARQIIDKENDFLGVENRRWVLANNDSIPLKKSRQVSAGLSYNKLSWFASVEALYKNVKGITSNAQGFSDPGQFDEFAIGSYNIWGVEFLINKRLGRYSGWLSYSFSENNYTFDNLDPSEFPNNIDIRHTLGVGFNYTWQDFKFSIGGKWRTGKPYTEPDPDNPVIEQNAVRNRINYQTANQERLPYYLRLDFSAIYSFKMGKKANGTLAGSIVNLLNRRNSLNIFYRLPELKSTEPERVENISLGLTPNVSFRVSF